MTKKEIVTDLFYAVQQAWIYNRHYAIDLISEQIRSYVASLPDVEWIRFQACFVVNDSTACDRPPEEVAVQVHLLNWLRAERAMGLLERQRGVF